jgi:hypothetical protein
MSQLRDKFKNYVRNQISQTQGSTRARIGSVVASNSDGTLTVAVDGVQYTCQTSFALNQAVGMQVLVMIDPASGQRTATPLTPGTPAATIIHPPFFSGGGVRLVAVGGAIGAGNLGTFMPSPPEPNIAIIQDTGSSKVFLLRDETLGLSPGFGVGNGAISPNGKFLSVLTTNGVDNNIRIIVYNIGSKLTVKPGTDPVNADQQIFLLQATKVQDTLHLAEFETTSTLTVSGTVYVASEENDGPPFFFPINSTVSGCSMAFEFTIDSIELVQDTDVDNEGVSYLFVKRNVTATYLSGAPDDFSSPVAGQEFDDGSIQDQFGSGYHLFAFQGNAQISDTFFGQAITLTLQSGDVGIGIPFAGTQGFLSLYGNSALPPRPVTTFRNPIIFDAKNKIITAVIPTQSQAIDPTFAGPCKFALLGPTSNALVSQGGFVWTSFELFWPSLPPPPTVVTCSAPVRSPAVVNVLLLGSETIDITNHAGFSSRARTLSFTVQPWFDTITDLTIHLFKGSIDGTTLTEMIVTNDPIGLNLRFLALGTSDAKGNMLDDVSNTAFHLFGIKSSTDTTVTIDIVQLPVSPNPPTGDNPKETRFTNITNFASFL